VDAIGDAGGKGFQPQPVQNEALAEADVILVIDSDVSASAWNVPAAPPGQELYGNLVCLQTITCICGG